LQTVISATKLFFLVSLGILYLLGLGWLIIGPMLHGSLTTRREDIPLLQEIPLAFMGGLITNYGIVLCFQSLKISLIVGIVISLIGAYGLVTYIFKHHILQTLTPLLIYSWLGIILVCLLFVSPILAQPLADWDARSIWFFMQK